MVVVEKKISPAVVVVQIPLMVEIRADLVEESPQVVEVVSVIEEVGWIQAE